MEFTYDWNLKDLPTPDKGTVFSCFSGGGGSSMGYKMAGFNVIGFNEIDPKMAQVYQRNMGVTYPYIQPLAELLEQKNLPEGLHALDILDGSPPCSSFSMAGNREKDWGKEKKFREGQSKQILDTLFFDFIKLARYLQPKVVVAENVKGLLIGRARGYRDRIHRELASAGYHVFEKLVNGLHLGLPQKRERVFIIGVRSDLHIPTTGFIPRPRLNLNFKSDPITFGQIRDTLTPFKPYSKLKGKQYQAWLNRKMGDKSLSEGMGRAFGYKTGFSTALIYPHKVCPTITATDSSSLLYDEFRNLTENELRSVGSWPKDYDFGGMNPHYVIGMSVPPLMMYKIAERLWAQILKPPGHSV